MDKKASNNKRNSKDQVNIKAHLILSCSFVFVFATAYFLLGLIPLWDCGGFSSSLSCKVLSFIEAAKEYRAKSVSLMGISLVIAFAIGPILNLLRRAKGTA